MRTAAYVREQLEALGVTHIRRKDCVMDALMHARWPTTTWCLRRGAQWNSIRSERLHLPAQDTPFVAELSNHRWRCFAIDAKHPWGLVIRREHWEQPDPPVASAMDDCGRKSVSGPTHVLSYILDHLDPL